MFERNSGGADNWGETRKLLASDGAAEDFFGISVGIDDRWGYGNHRRQIQ
ncbi:FG-GAP repeat protein [Thiolapillus sp.]